MQAPEQLSLFEPPPAAHAEGGRKSSGNARTPPGEGWKLVELPDAQPGVGFVRFPEGWRCVEVALIDPPENGLLFRDLRKRGEAILGVTGKDGKQITQKARQAIYRGQPMGWEERFRLAQCKRPAVELVRELDPEAEPWISSLR